MAGNLKALLKKTQLLHPTEVEDKACIVCLEDYLQGPSREWPRKLPCGHLIGSECLCVWASSHTRVTSTKCPWSSQRIISPVRRKRAARAVNREHVEYGSRLIDLAFLFASRVTYYGNPLTWLLLGFLYAYTSTAVKRRVSVHPRLGIMLLVLGFYIVILSDKNIGCLLIKYGKAPFETTILRFYKNHMWAVLGLSLVVVYVQFVLANLTGGAHGYYSSLHVLLGMHALSWLELGFI